jgi:hypothetical protein
MGDDLCQGESGSGASLDAHGCSLSDRWISEGGEVRNRAMCSEAICFVLSEWPAMAACFRSPDH